MPWTAVLQGCDELVHVDVHDAVVAESTHPCWAAAHVKIAATTEIRRVL